MMEGAALTKSSFDRLAEEWRKGVLRWIDYVPPQIYYLNSFSENDDDIHISGRYDSEIGVLIFYDHDYVGKELLKDIVNNIRKDEA